MARREVELEIPPIVETDDRETALTIQNAALRERIFAQELEILRLKAQIMWAFAEGAQGTVRAYNAVQPKGQ